MSRDTDRLQVLHMGFPRVSGDEPWYQWYQVGLFVFSPRERG